MCGFCGIYHYGNRAPVDRRVAGKMLKALEHRGPDDEGVYYDLAGSLYLGHRRLSIIDLTTGHQPIANEDESLWIVFNGEIYNYQELRHTLELKGHQFRTRSDTETIIHAYEEWGFDSFSRLNGIYAFALWDSGKRHLYITRDPYGVKPVYYWDNGSSLIFASETKSLFHHPLIKREIDPVGLGSYFSLTYVPSPKTAFRDISKLPPGYMLKCDGNNTELTRFYHNPPQEIAYKAEEELVEELQHQIDAAVRRQMIADVPVGAMLSGGVDSSTMVSIMARTNADNLKTFTVGFEGNFKWNELKRARQVAGRIGTEHHEIIISADDYREFLPRSVWYLEEPVSTGSTLAYYMVCKLARDYVKVVLTGQGADEPFAGYPRHFGEHYGKLYRSIPLFVQKMFFEPAVKLIPRNERLKRAVKSLKINDPVLRLREIYDTFHTGLWSRLLREDIQQPVDEYLYSVIAGWQSDVNHLDQLNQMTYVDSRLSLADNLLMYGDKMSMAVSLEARVPFLDIRLMEFVESIPAHYKIKGFTQKYLLKKAVSRWLPEEEIKRPKIGFTTPLDDWFKQELMGEVRDRLLSPGSAAKQFFQPSGLEKIISAHARKRQDYKRILFSLLTFEYWYDLFIRPSSWK
ncbi:MAG: asparagine synthase (glutamine-hydrolyzing) [bacterium]|nr:MAG: asparagine synthase (glutamine-hydrolyzing) [bacterium]